MTFIHLLLATFFFADICLAQTNVASVAERNEFPISEPISVAESTWVYQIYRNVFLDLDQIMQDSGLNLNVCSYKNNLLGTTVSYHGLGPCLFNHFIDSMNSDKNVGVTFFWIKARNGKSIPVRIDWRPTGEGWSGTFKELVALQFEGFSQWWMKLTMKAPTDDMQKINFTQNFLGKIKLSFPPEIYLTEVFLEQSFTNSLLLLDKVHEVSFKMNPLGKKENQIQYQGQILISKKINLNPSGEELTSIEFITNINLLKPSRPYKLKGRLGEKSPVDGIVP